MNFKKWFALSNDNLLRKSFYTTAALFAFMLLAAGMAFCTTNLWRNSLFVVYQEQLVPSQKLQDIVEKMEDIRFRLAAVLGDRLPAVGSRKRTEEAWVEIEAKWKEYKEIVTTQSSEEAELFKSVEAGYALTQQTVASLVEVYKSGDQDKIGEVLDSQWPKVVTEFLSPMRNLLVVKKDSIRLAYEDANLQANRFSMALGAGILLAFGVGVVAMFIVSRFKTQSEEIIKELSEMNAVLNQASGNMSSTSELLARTNERNRQSIHETSAALEEITSMVQSTANHANKSRELSDETAQAASKGEAALGEMSQAISSIDGATQAIFKEMGKVNQELEHILKIFKEVESKTKVINDIVFQTRLLSFNASVEAARAGEHGKGFAVVAQEVGNLAQLSGTSAQEISSILNTGLVQVQSIVGNIRDNMQSLTKMAQEKTQEGSEKASHTAAVFNEIISSIGMVKEMMLELNKSTQEQTIGVGEVNQAMQEINKASEEGAQAVAETHSSSKNIKSESDRLTDVVGRFETIIHGQNKKPEAKIHSFRSADKSKKAA